VAGRSAEASRSATFRADDGDSMTVRAVSENVEPSACTETGAGITLPRVTRGGAAEAAAGAAVNGRAQASRAARVTRMNPTLHKAASICEDTCR
jgi:hypothetical protein